MAENYKTRQKSGQDPTSSHLIFLRSDQIHPNRSQPRVAFEQNSIIRLADSIKRYGILQPLSVRPAKGEQGSGYYELIAGERRYRAACLAGLTKIPCIVLRADDKQCAELAVIENLQREDLNMFEQAGAFRTLMQDFGLTQEEIARKMSMSQSAIANKLRLLRLEQEEREIILRAGLTERHARALLRLDTPEARELALTAVLEGRLNVAATEEWIDQYLQKYTKKAVKSVVLTPELPKEGQICPRKFVLHDLRALYNSIERTLSIFRKTGAAVESTREEADDFVRITIYIPKGTEGSAAQG